MSALTVHVATSFDDPCVSPATWQRLLDASERGSVFLTREFQRAWWETFDDGRILLVVVERDGEPIALAPLVSDGWTASFAGAASSESLDVLGETSVEALAAIVAAVREHGLGALELVPVRDGSRTASGLEQAAARGGLEPISSRYAVAPLVDLATDPARARAAADRKSLVRHERFFRRGDELDVLALSDGHAILPHLDALFEQHVERWASTPHPSLFAQPRNRDFFRRLTLAAADTGWLRFTRLDWQGRAIAFHYGFCHLGRYHWYVPSFAIDLARRSPGEALLRLLLLAALEEGAHTFDFGLGDEPFKRRFATSHEQLRWWGLYAPQRAEGQPTEVARAAG